MIGHTGLPQPAARATCTALSTFGSSTADTPAWRAHSARSSACSGCVGALIRTNTRACEFSLRKASRLSRASRFRSSATASSRSTITTSAPVAKALGMRSGRVAGTNSAVRMMFEFMVVPFIGRFSRSQSERTGEGEAAKLLDRQPSGSYGHSYRTLLMQALDIGGRVAQLGEQCIGVLAERGYRVHARREGGVATWRQQGRQGAGRAVDFTPALAGLKLR